MDGMEATTATVVADVAGVAGGEGRGNGANVVAAAGSRVSFLDRAIRTTATAAAASTHPAIRRMGSPPRGGVAGAARAI
jgi:hypothetical protein